MAFVNPKRPTVESLLFAIATNPPPETSPIAPAIAFVGTGMIYDASELKDRDAPTTTTYMLRTLRGDVELHAGDYLIKDADGNVDAISATEWAALYEEALTAAGINESFDLLGMQIETLGALDVLVGGEDKLAELPPVIVQLQGGVAAGPPAVGNFAVGDHYFNGVDYKLYILEAGTPNAWAEDAANLTMNKLFVDGEGGLFTYNGLSLHSIGLTRHVANQAASTAAALADLVTDFNALLTKLKAGGIMVADA